MSSDHGVSPEATRIKGAISEIQGILSVDGCGQIDAVAELLQSIGTAGRRLDSLARARLDSLDALTAERNQALEDQAAALKERDEACRARDKAEGQEDIWRKRVADVRTTLAQERAEWKEYRTDHEHCAPRNDFNLAVIARDDHQRTIEVQKRSMQELEDRAINLQNRLAEATNERDEAIIARNLAQQSRRGGYLADAEKYRGFWEMSQGLHRSVMRELRSALKSISRYHRTVIILQASLPRDKPCTWCGQEDGVHMAVCPRRDADRFLLSMGIVPPVNRDPSYDDDDDDEEPDDDETDTLDDVPF